jgi:hypothetical protein
MRIELDFISVLAEWPLLVKGVSMDRWPRWGFNRSGLAAWHCSGMV